MRPYLFDLDKLIHFFQELYAHAPTLQDLVQTADNRTYERIKPQYDRQAAEQFEIFYRALNDPRAFAKAVQDLLDTHPKNQRGQ